MDADAGAFQTLLNRDLVVPCEKLFVLGGGNVGLIAAYHALQADIDVVGLAEAKAGTDKTDLEKTVPLLALADLLPGLGKIIGEFDFIEAQLTAVRDGEQPGTWREYRVTLVPPIAAASSVTSK